MWIDKQPPFETTGRNEIVEAAEHFAGVAIEFGNARGWIQQKRQAAGLDTATEEFIADMSRTTADDTLPLRDALIRACSAVGSHRLKDGMACQGMMLLQFLDRLRNAACDELDADNIAAEVADIGHDEDHKLAVSAGFDTSSFNERRHKMIDECEQSGDSLDAKQQMYRSAADAILLMLEAAWRESQG